jgi:hypothetical protein
MRVRFTIRDLLLLTALATVAGAWWLDHRVQVNRYQVLINDTPTLIAYHINRPDPKIVLKALKDALADAVDVRLEFDPTSDQH